MAKPEDYLPKNSNNNNTSVRSLYESRQFYNNYTVPYILNEYIPTRVAVSQNDNIPAKLYIPISDLYEKNVYYGIIDNDGDITIPIDDMKNFSLVGYDFEGNPLYLQNFVAEALKDMVTYLDAKLLSKCCSPDLEKAKSSAFFNIKVKKAYTKFTGIDRLYESGAKIVGSKFKQYASIDKKLDSSIEDLDTFTKKYIPFVKEHLQIAPVTKSRLTSFYNLLTYSSGITFAISDDEAGNEDVNYKKYFLDIAFFEFSKACVEFGFKMDKHNPFIIHADLNSQALKKYYSKDKYDYEDSKSKQKYKLNNIKDIFIRRYKKAHLDDIDELKKFFINSYNAFLYQNDYYTPFVDDFCIDDKENIQAVKYRYYSNKYSEEQYFQKYQDTFWMRLYVYYKSLEMNMDFKQEEFETIVKKANSLIKLNMKNEALNFVNSKFNTLKGTKYFHDLQQKNSVLQHVYSSGRSEIKF